MKTCPHGERNRKHCRECTRAYNAKYHLQRKTQPPNWTPNLPPPPPCPASRLLREWPKGADTGPVTWTIRRAA